MNNNEMLSGFRNHVVEVCQCRQGVKRPRYLRMKHSQRETWEQNTNRSYPTTQVCVRLLRETRHDAVKTVTIFTAICNRNSMQ